MNTTRPSGWVWRWYLRVSPLQGPSRHLLLDGMGWGFFCCFVVFFLSVLIFNLEGSGRWSPFLMSTIPALDHIFQQKCCYFCYPYPSVRSWSVKQDRNRSKRCVRADLEQPQLTDSQPGSQTTLPPSDGVCRAAAETRAPLGSALALADSEQRGCLA